ncbi:hypothetical protein ABE61_17320 [Lysinibacillus sphaericus]|uniref:hypothetical protein n=1 Tax=Lysinibacillus sphaericus TaxID=1421 RepID=UPI0018CF55D0|nr:hypothetical protein [Lysinibacillus sphaericus]MBG9455765.1 hypothetical protein [Lysinibacillus sphaericus]MBG9477784.1 hypothetical protein [Lysinibacillus sphaericus]MBG9593243.1 hypothetical protein [Lysinibacillus sphaericus]
MKKPIKKSWMIASALTIGMAVLTPLQAGATSVEPTNGVTVQIEQQITGTITSINGVGVELKGIDGKIYYISFFKFTDEQLKQMNLVAGQEITVEGGVVENFADFYTFEVYKKDLPKNVPNEELTKLEKMFSEGKKLEKEASNAITNKKMDEAEKKFEEMNKIYEEMHKITKPYYLASWQPQPFEEFLEDYGFSENNIVIAENDKNDLKAIYEEWIKLEKDGQEEKAKEKMKGFNKILQPYLEELYPTPTFEEYIGRLDLLEIPTETLAKLKNFYEDYRKAEKEENYDLFDEIWVEFHDILGPFIIPQTFEEYMSSFEFKVNKADSKQLKQLYEEILKLDRKEDLAKIEEKWEAFYTILEPYFEANKAILLSASKLTINGQDFLSQ